MAQGGFCAGCGQKMTRKFRRPGHPLAPTFDHVLARSVGGTQSLQNGLVKHERCNQQRGSRAANGCDRIWHSVVLERIDAMRLLVEHEKVRKRTEQRERRKAHAAELKKRAVERRKLAAELELGSMVVTPNGAIYRLLGMPALRRFKPELAEEGPTGPV